jgi:hypothetical protein
MRVVGFDQITGANGDLTVYSKIRFGMAVQAKPR